MPQYKGNMIMREKILTMGLINYLFMRVSRCCWRVPASQKIVGRFSLEEIVSFSIIWVDTPICYLRNPEISRGGNFFILVPNQMTCHGLLTNQKKSLK